MEFQYTDSMGRYQELMGMPLASLRCKHVMSLLSPKALKQYKYSLETGYPQAVWGYGCGIYGFVPRTPLLIFGYKIQ